MFRKLLVSAVLLSTVATAAFANFANNSSQFYVGGGVGLSMLETRTSVNNPSFRHDLGGFGFIGGGFAGFNMRFCRFDVGVEGFIFGNTVQNKTKNAAIGNSAKLENRFNYGVRVLPGYWWSCDVEMHLIVGYTRTNLRFRNDNVSLGTFRREFDLNGYQVGGGITLPISCNLSMRMDGVFSGYESHHRTVLVDSIERRFRAQPNTFDTTVSLVYSF